MSKRTWNPKSKKRIRKHGFLSRMRTASGRKVIARRRTKGRQRVSVSK